MRRLGLLLAVALSGCTDSGGSGESSVAALVRTVGPISDANVEVHAVGDNGAPQRLLGTTTTGADGSFSLSVSGYSGWTLVKAWGGTYVDAATGSNATIPQATPLLGVARTGSPTPAVVTRATTMLTMDAQELARDPGISFGDAVANSALRMQAITGVPDVHLTMPADLTQGPASAGPEAAYGALLAGYSEYAFNLGVTGPELGYAAARDAKDGKFDGLEYLDAVPLNLSTDLSPGFLAFLGTFSQAWLELNPGNASGLGAADLPQLSALSAANNMMPAMPRVQAVWNGHSPLAGGTEVTVRGWGFGMTPVVLVAGTEVAPTIASDTEIVFDSPASAATGPADLEIRTALSGGYYYKALQALRYYDEQAAPTVTGLRPAEGPIAGGTPITITGANLDPGTRVFFGSTEALVTGGTFPRTIFAITPRSTVAGTCNVRVENSAALSFTLSAGYRYKDKDVGRLFDDSYFSGGFTALYQKWDYSGTEPRITLGTSIWNLNGAGQGTFTRADKTMLESGTTESTASGTAFATAEGQNGQVLTVDTGTNATNLYAVKIHPNGTLGAGLTAYGTTALFRHGSGLGASTLSGKYGVSASFVRFNPTLSFGFGAGTAEFDGEGAGGINLKVTEREGYGTGFRQYTLNLPFSYSVQPNGSTSLALDPGSATAWDLNGWTTSDGAFGSFYYAGTGAWQGRSTALKMVRLDPGIAPEDYCDECDGGYMKEQTFDDGVDIFPKFTAYLGNRLQETSGTTGRHYQASDGGSLSPGPVDRIFLRGGVSLRALGQFGRVEHEDGSVEGFYSPGLRISVSSGKIAESVDFASFGDRMVYGFAIGFDSHYSKWSISGAHNLLSWESGWLNPGTLTGDETNRTEIGSVTFNPAKSVTIGGDAFSGFGGFDDYTSSTKTVTRVGLEATTSFSGTPDLMADFAYGFLGDRAYHVLAEREDAGPLGGYRAGVPLGVGAFSPSGGLVAWGSTSKYDVTSFKAFAPKVTWSIGTSYRYGAFLADFDGTTGATNMRVERGAVVTSPSVMQDFRQRLFVEGGSSSTSTGSRSGSVTTYADGKVDLQIGAQVFGGFGIGGGEMLLLTDFTDNRQTGIQVLTRDLLAPPPLLDHGFMFLEKVFSGSSLPAPTDVILRSGTYTPVNNLVSVVALDQIRANDAEETALGRRFDTGTASTSANGGFTFDLGGAGSGGITSGGLYGFGMAGPETDAPTAMNLGIFMRF